MLRKSVLACVALAALVGCAATQPGSSSNEIIISLGDRGTYMQIQNPAADARFRYAANSNHPCLRGYLRAKVEWTDRDLIVQPIPNMDDCPTFRWQVRRDGSGGERQLLLDGKWVKQEFNRSVKIL